MRLGGVKELAEEANVSLGLAFKIKERLLDMEYASDEQKAIVLSRPQELLDKWSESYSFRRNQLHDYFSFDEPKDVERRLAQYCVEGNIPYALTMFSGAALVAPFARYNRGFAYVGSRAPEVAMSLGLKDVASGPNFTILEPYDEGVFYGARTIKTLEVVSDVQLYIDLVTYKGRGEESAQFLLEQRLKTQW